MSLKNLLLFSILLIAAKSFGQQPDSLINLFGEKFPQESVYIHFDKQAYSAGETIWFKAYLKSGFLPSAISHNFFAELYDEHGRLLQQKIYPLYEATAAGNFDLPDSLAGSSVTIRGYTSWQLNFDTAFLFTKNIQLINSRPIDPVRQFKPAVTKLRFFPEGGNLVAGLESVLAFNAVDENENPVNIAGDITDQDGKFISGFSASHDGMGQVNFQPQRAAIYFANWTDVSGKLNHTALPAVSTQGVVLHCMLTKNNLVYVLRRSDSVAAVVKKMHVLAHMNQQVVYKATINMEDDNITSGIIPITIVPTGILTITVLDDNWQSLAERIVFINNRDFSFDANINVTSIDMRKRAKNIIEIEVPDTLRTNLSLSVTDIDAAVNFAEADNIFSAFFLRNELRGKIINPAFYFSSDADSVKKFLDLVMLTHGWRRFEWNDILTRKGPVIKYQPENFLSIRADLTVPKHYRFQSNESVNLILEGADSSKYYLSLPVRNDASVYGDGFVFYDTVKIYYQFAKDRDLRNRAELRFAGPIKRKFKGIDIKPSAIISADFDTVQSTRIRFFAEEAERIKPLLSKKYKQLETITIRAKRNARVQQLDKNYTSGLFSGGDAYSYDLESENNNSFTYMNIFEYLQGKVAGLSINRNGSDYTASWRGDNTAFFVDEFPVDLKEVEFIPVTQIAYVKVFRPPFMGAAGAAGGAVAIYTKKGAGSDPRSAKGLEKGFIVGYNPPKEFYSPDYSKASVLDEVPDLRTTLYWTPYILTDAVNRKARIEFYNNDVSKKLKAVLEGMNEEGKMVHIEKIIE